jgi:CBS domain-containing protein
MMDVKDVMTRDVHCVAAETPLHEVADLLVEHGISGVPVCDAEGAVVGVVSEADILFKERGPELRRRGFLSALAVGLHSVEDAKVAARTAGEAMTQPAITITPTRPVAAAAGMMLEHGVNRLPVVRRGELVGIVTRADLVRAFRRTDAAIEREIRNEVIEQLLWLEPYLVELTVSDGEVSLAGRLEQRSDAELLAKLVRRVPGVIAVESRLTWRIDDTGRRGVSVSSGVE